MTGSIPFENNKITVENSILALAREWVGFDAVVSKVTVPDPSGDGPNSVVAVQIPNGYWYMLRARIMILLAQYEEDQEARITALEASR